MTDAPPPLSRDMLRAVAEHAQTDRGGVLRFLAGNQRGSCAPRVRAALVHYGCEAHLAAADRAATIQKGGDDDD